MPQPEDEGYTDTGARVLARPRGEVEQRRPAAPSADGGRREGKHGAVRNTCHPATSWGRSSSATSPSLASAISPARAAACCRARLRAWACRPSRMSSTPAARRSQALPGIASPSRRRVTRSSTCAMRDARGALRHDHVMLEKKKKKKKKKRLRVSRLGLDGAASSACSARALRARPSRWPSGDPAGVRRMVARSCYDSADPGRYVTTRRPAGDGPAGTAQRGLPRGSRKRIRTPRTLRACARFLSAAQATGHG